VLSDQRCAFGAIRLPSLAPAPLPRDREGIGCEFELSPDGTRVGPPGSAWSRDGRVLARDAGGAVRVRELGQASEGAFDGSIPAWAPGGALTVVRYQDVVQVTACRPRDARPCELVRLSHTDLLRAARRHLNWPDEPGAGWFVVEDVAWLTATRAAVLLAIRAPSLRPPQELVAIFERRVLVGARSYLNDVVQVDAQGPYVLAQPQDVLRHDGSAVPGASLTGLRSLAVAPDGRWLAGASEGAIHLVRLEPGPGVRTVDLPIAARDVAWR
jgi:hypothetical protein